MIVPNQHGIQNVRIFIVDIWLVIMSDLSVMDLVRLGRVSVWLSTSDELFLC
jgi:hypothetical protein